MDISQELQQLLTRQRAERAAEQSRRPAGFENPPYGTREYFEAVKWGWITEAEMEADELAYIERSRKAKAAMGNRADRPARYHHAAPQESRQYANQMATAAFRDRRLVPEAKALLAVLRARCGRGRVTATTKTTLARIMRRHPRSIQRYLADLIRFGYIQTAIRRGAEGLYTGLVVTITEAVTPFYAKGKELAQWLAETAVKGKAQLRLIGFNPHIPVFPDRTGLSPKNPLKNNPFLSIVPRGT